MIDTALELIWKNSYGSVSVDDICKAADVKKGSFYHFFPSKVDLAIAAMEESYRETKPLYDAMFSPASPPVRRFEQMADFILAKQAEAAAKYGRVCGCPCASLGSEMAGQEEGIRAKFEDIAHRQERYYENALRDMVAEGLLPEATDVKVLAQEIYTYLLGQIMIARIQNDLEPLKRDLKPGLLRLLGIGELPSQPV
ncbi:TetR/AcrR family transcriptional regulator [Phaeospirillum tilakii]|uniref:TetR/AcrR family transcriptional regulator n=1 Tax=Phaeospirillum tilakii TaxID=741673 RepID=A0ABW5C8P3_9PROT